MSDFKFRLREIVMISAPIILEQVFINLMGVVNTMMVSSVGEYAVSAVGIVESVSQIIIALFSALITGGTIVIAQYIGKKDHARATEASAQAVLLSVFFSVFIFAIFFIFRNAIISSLLGETEQNVIDAASSYFTIVNFSFPILAVTQTIFGVLRGSGNTGTPMLITIMMNVLNVILGFTLIFGLDINFFSIWSFSSPGLGVQGAAMALTFARLAGMIVSLIYIVRFSKIIRLNHLKYFHFNLKVQKVILGLGIPTSIESSLFQVGKLITQIYIVGMGVTAMAANSISGSLFAFINVPGSALSSGVMILVGHRVGAGMIDDVESTSFFAVKIGTVMMAMLCLTFFISNDFLISLYKPGPDTAEIIRLVMISGYIATPIFWPLSFITPAALRAAGDVKFTMYVAIASMWIFRILVGYVFGVLMGWGVLGVWFGMYTDWLVRGVMFYFRTKKIGGRLAARQDSVSK